MLHTTSLITILASGLALAFILGLITNRINISPFIAYITAGFIANMLQPNYVNDIDSIAQLAELGTVLLMFGIGLNFSPKRLLTEKVTIIPSAITQVIITTLLSMAITLALEWSVLTSLIFGLCLSTSGAIITLKTLEKQQQLGSMQGKLTLDWLASENLVIVIVLILLPIISNTLNSSTNTLQQLLSQSAITMAKFITFITIVFIAIKQFLPWLLSKSAASGSRELFSLSILTIALSIALSTVELFDAPFSLGAFLAGVLVRESGLNRRTIYNALPLKNAFSVLFFVTLGMLFDPSVVIKQPLIFFIAVTIITVIKPLIIYFLTRMHRYTRRTAFTISINLAQVGEFTYVLAALAVTLGDLSRDIQSIIIATIIFSIVINHLLYKIGIYYLNRNENSVEQLISASIVDDKIAVPNDINNHTIIVGCGDIGFHLIEQLTKQHTPLVVIEQTLDGIEKLRKLGIFSVLGNAVLTQHLLQAHICSARNLIITAPKPYEAGEIILRARQLQPNLTICAFVHYEDEEEYIKNRGADHVIVTNQRVADDMLAILECKQDAVK